MELKYNYYKHNYYKYNYCKYNYYKSNYYKYNYYKSKLNVVFFKNYFTPTFIEDNWLTYTESHLKLFPSLFLFFKQSNFKLPSHFKNLPSSIRFTQINIYNKFVNMVCKRGLKHKLYAAFTQNFKFLYFLYFQHLNIHTDKWFNLNTYFREVWLALISQTLPVLTLESHRIEKKKRKAMRIKHKFSYIIKYTPAHRRLQVIYKWLKLDFLNLNARGLTMRFKTFLSLLLFNYQKLLLFKVTNTLHNKLLLNYLAKRVIECFLLQLTLTIII